MYRICDLISDSGKTLRKNIDVELAKEGNRLILSGFNETYTVKRVHGYSLFND